MQCQRVDHALVDVDQVSAGCFVAGGATFDEGGFSRVYVGPTDSASVLHEPSGNRRFHQFSTVLAQLDPVPAGWFPHVLEPFTWLPNDAVHRVHISLVNRPIVVAVGAMALAASLAFVWLDARQQREYRRLLAAGDDAVARGTDPRGHRSLQRRPDAEAGFDDCPPDARRDLPAARRILVSRARPDRGCRARSDCPATARTARRRARRNGTAPGGRDPTTSAACASTTAHRASCTSWALPYYRNGDVPQAIDVPSASGEPRRSPAAGALPARFVPPRPAAAQSGRARAAPGRGARSDHGGRARRARHPLHRFRTAAAGHRATRGTVGARAERDRSDSSASGWPTRGLDATMPPCSRSDRAAERHPDSSLVYTALGRVWLDVAENQRDPEALDKAIEVLAPLAEQPNATSEALTMYGRALLLSGNLAAAEYELRRATEQFPSRAGRLYIPRHGSHAARSPRCCAGSRGQARALVGG